MAFLLDTHALLWYLEDDNALSETAIELIETATNLVAVSVVSFWEIAIKVSAGKLTMRTSFADIRLRLERLGFTLLPVHVADAERVLTLPFHHRDPFDRMLVAQCLTHQLSLVSRDAALRLYPVQCVW